ncbi:MAG: small subunit ribosomal protein [Solirubrobacteraceae bacterium]|nr:small subunit ribosomal protein [Solirubrobacteraceae bacterium]
MLGRPPGLPFMAAHDPLYDLVLMLDSAAPDEQRQKVLTGAEQTIIAGGEIVNEQDWGVRQTAYEIRHKTDAEYHLLQFHGTRQVLETLQRTLRIADGVVRFRIIKLAPGTPAPPASRPEPRPMGIGEPVAVEAVPAYVPADALG